MPDSPPVRRHLRIQAFNWTLNALKNAGLMVRPLDMDSLIEAARRRTGLTNFGDTTFHEPLHRLLDSCKNDARLNAIGRLVCTEDILQLLCNRLEIQRDAKKWPDMTSQTIAAPVFITGLPRSGTTLLHNLLELDRREFYAPATWQVMFPSPPPFTGQFNGPRMAALGGMGWTISASHRRIRAEGLPPTYIDQ